MDYEKAYKEALERARSGMQTDEVFPELKESEDERIRKLLLDRFQLISEMWFENIFNGYLSKEQFIAWLEKQKYEYEVFEPIESTLEYKEGFKAGVESERQKEQKPAEWKPEPESLEALMYAIEGKLEMIKPTSYLSRRLEDLYEGLVNTFNVDESLVVEFTKTAYSSKDIEEIKVLKRKIDESMEQKTVAHEDDFVSKPAEWSEDCREDDLRTRFAFYTYKDEDSVLYLSNVFVEEASRNKGFGTKILAAAEKVAETLGANAIRLKVKQNSPANAWYRKHGYGYMAFEGDYDWLEKTMEYLKPKQVWSEEDEAKKERLISIVKRALHGNEYPFLNDNGATELITWLKSLRPQPHWKPSQEQMTILERIVNDIKTKFTGATVKEQLTLESLFNDLKKL